VAPDRDRQVRAARRVLDALLRPAPDVFSSITAVNTLSLFVQAVPVSDFSPFSVLDNQVPGEELAGGPPKKPNRSSALPADTLQNQNRGTTSTNSTNKRRSSLLTDIESGARTSKATTADVPVTIPPARPAAAFPIVSFRTRQSSSGSESRPADKRLLNFPAVSSVDVRSTIAPGASEASAPDIAAAVRTVVSKLRGMNEESDAAPEQTAGALISSITLISELVNALLVAPEQAVAASLELARQRGETAKETTATNLLEQPGIIGTPIDGSTFQTVRPDANLSMNKPDNSPPAAQVTVEPQILDAESLTFLVNQVLSEQARRHGVDLS
jgi:hypothetical protein